MKESLNSDGQQFHQYPKKKTINSHFNSLNTEKKNPQHMMLQIHVLAWDRHKIVAGLFLLFV